MLSGRRNLSPEELRERQAELAKVKALMFYEQMKRHRLNKIKSKAYRRIRKRQRLKRESDDKVDITSLTYPTHSISLIQYTQHTPFVHHPSYYLHIVLPNLT